MQVFTIQRAILDANFFGPWNLCFHTKLHLHLQAEGWKCLFANNHLRVVVDSNAGPMDSHGRSLWNNQSRDQEGGKVVG